MNIRNLLLSAILLFLCSQTMAAKLFAISADYNGGADSLMVENSSLPNLVEDLVKNYGDFSALQGETAFVANLTYFAVPDALVLAFDCTDPSIIRLRVKSSLINLDRLL